MFRAASRNLLPRFIPSIYIAMTPVDGSLLKYSIKSTSSVSALLPVLITLHRPSSVAIVHSARARPSDPLWVCLLYTSDAADDLLCVDLGGRRIIKKKKK